MTLKKQADNRSKIVLLSIFLHEKLLDNLINICLITNIYQYGRLTYVIKIKNKEEHALLTYEKYKESKKFFSL